MKPVRIGTRISALAMWQAQWVQNAISEIGIATEIVPIHSSGDNNLVQPLYEMSVVGIFTKELDQALLLSLIHI